MNIPAGLTDNNLEVFLHNNQVKALQNGNTVNYTHLPMVMRKPFQDDLLSDIKAMECLKLVFGLKTMTEQEVQFVACRYGALDHTADYDGETLKTDAPVCKKIASCKGFGVVCKVPGHLSRSEYRVTQMVSNGLQDIEIADSLNIRISTVRTHLSRIRDKIGVNNRIEVSRWAQDKGIV